MHSNVLKINPSLRFSRSTPFTKGRRGENIGLPPMFSALGDATRFSIFTILADRKDVCVSDIAKIIGVSIPAASHHLKILETAGLDRKERMGQMICYKIKEGNSVVRSIIKIIKNGGG